MPKKVDRKSINKRADKIGNGWQQGAKTVKFKGHTHDDLTALRTEIRTEEEERDDFQAQADLKDQSIEDKYKRLDDMLVDVGKGVAGHEEYGDDSPLYGEMGFTRTSQRKSGLRRSGNNPGGSQ